MISSTTRGLSPLGCVVRYGGHEFYTYFALRCEGSSTIFWTSILSEGGVVEEARETSRATLWSVGAVGVCWGALGLRWAEQQTYEEYTIETHKIALAVDRAKKLLYLLACGAVDQ